ncbi:beta/alpha barrel domain-containing protein [Halomonas sp. NCCP-2165]|nr:hypothetical protein [Halomonas sp. NCCP-2165]GKW48948.1 hypothetical protein NCCP2165_11630 [Halomonas sp. NCCP-2165]
MSAPLTVSEDELVLLTDLYQLTMTQAYWKEAMAERATFSLFFRRLPPTRRFMLACGQQHAAALVPRLRFGEARLAQLGATGLFEAAFLDWLGEWRFSGEIRTLPEGTPVFADEPLLEVDAPIAEAQLLESLLMNLVQLETLLASKAVRLVIAARGRPVVDFGLRRMHGIDAAVRGGTRLSQRRPGGHQQCAGRPAPRPAAARHHGAQLYSRPRRRGRGLRRLRPPLPEHHPAGGHP